MLAKIIIIFAVATAATAIAPGPGYVSSAYALGSQAEHTIRGYGGLTSVSKQAKVIDSPYATVRKTDIRLTNDAGYAAHPALTGLTYTSPAIAHGYHHAPAYTQGYHHTPAIATHGYHAAPTIAHGYHAAPAIAHGYHAAPIAHGYRVPAGVTYNYGHPGYTASATPIQHAPLGYTSAHHGAALTLPSVAKGVAVPSGLGVAYSPATSVATATFSGYGVHYGY